MLIFLSADTTAVSKTASTVSPEARQAADAEKDQDSGSDYGGDWSEDEWNDAQVSRNNSLPAGGNWLRRGLEWGTSGLGALRGAKGR